MKKIICLVLGAAMFVGTLAFAQSETTTVSKYQYATDVMLGLGLMNAPENEREWENVVTRGEFAEIIYKILNYDSYDVVTDEWETNFYGDKNANTELITDIAANDGIYNDVDSENKYYDAILYLGQSGLMVGYGNDSFGVDDAIVPHHAAKIIIDLMGYQAVAEKLGPDGYKKIASNLDLIITGSSSMTKEETAQFIYNALVTEYDDSYDGTVTFGEGDHTILGKYMGLSYVEGTVVDNGYISLDGGDTVGAGKLVIADETLYIDQTEYDTTELLARHVGAFYKSEGEENEYNVVFAHLTCEDECFEILGRDVEDYASRTLTYNTDSNTEKEKLSTGVTVVYNYKIQDTYTSNIFKSNNSKIKLIIPRGKSEAEYAVIEDYESVFVNAVDGTDVYNGIQYASKAVQLDFDDDDKAVLIYKADGTRGSMKDIKANMLIDIMSGENILVARISSNSINEFTVASTGTNDYGKFYSDSTAEYNLYDGLNDAINLVEIKLKNTYKVYLNIFGDIGWITTVDGTTTKQCVFLHKVYYDSENEQYGMRILDTKNEWYTIQFAEKLTFSDENGKESRLKPEATYGHLIDYRSLIRYKVNDEGKVNYIEIAITDKTNTSEDKLRLLDRLGYEDADGDGNYDGAYWRVGGGNIGPNVIIENATTKFITQNPELDSDSKEAYSFKTNILQDYKAYTLDAFTTSPISHRAQYAYMITKASSSSLDTEMTDYAVVKKISEVLDEKDEAAIAVDIYDLPNESYGSNQTLYLKNPEVLENIKSGFEEEDEEGNVVKHDLGEGDIIRYVLDAYGKIELIQLFWDADKPNSLSPNGKEGGFAGTIDWWDPTKTGRTNPFAFTGYDVEANKLMVSDDPTNFMVRELRGMSGYIYKLYDDVITVTTQDLSCKTYDKTESDSRFISESYLLKNPNYYTVVTIEEDEVTAAYGNQSDIKPYDKYGNNCSRAVLFGGGGGAGRIIIINDNRR